MPKWVLRKDFRFEASHQLMHHDGKCARLHGHSYTLTVEVAGDRLQPRMIPNIVDGQPYQQNPKGNMLMDYGDIKTIVQPLVNERLDHWHLNETFNTDMPTSEFLAEAIFGILAPQIDGLIAIEISETCTSFCRYEA